MMKNNKLIEYLQENYPSLVNETKDGNLEVNFNKLKEELNDVNISEETYGLNWMGKSYARVLRDYPVTTLIEPDNNHNNLEENKNSKNVYIEGDNLEVLKHLKNAYSNKIKMIYIDPPYNTGSDGFVYNDTFNFKVEDFMQLANVDEDEARKILDYTTSERSSHSAWLTFMYPRLYIARELLKEDGVIFISIDDNEQAQLKLLCDEIFGEDNFIANFIWEKTYSPKNNNKFASTNHDYVLSYAKNKNTLQQFNKLERSEKQNEFYKYNDEDGRGWYGRDNLTMNKKRGYDIVWNNRTYKEPKNGWRFAKEKMYELIKDNRIYLPESEAGVPRLKRYLNEVGGVVTKTILPYTEVSHTDKAKKDLDNLLKPGVFDYPKPSKLICRLCQLVLSNCSNDIILDFFSGSSTTADAVMQLNAEENGNRKFIMVQLPEEIDEKNSKEAYEFCTKELKQEPIIPTIAKERIKRAAKKIKEENKDKEYINDIDFGFKVYKTIEDKRTKLSDIKEFDVNQKLLFDTDNLEALLTTWMLYDGYDLNTKVENFSINKYNGYLVESTLYLMDKDFSTKDLKTLVEKLSDEQTPIINRIVINEVNFTNKMLAEINEQVFDKNIKEVNINVIKRV